jgi:soluble lytic murein transglycosylase
LQSLGLDTAAEERLTRMEQEAARAYDGRESEALCTMYGHLSCAGRRHYVGSRAASFELLMKPPSEAERWAWSCVYPGPYADLVTHEERTFELPRGLVYAVMRQESAFKPSALSPVGAQGLMQLMPNTARRAAEELSLGEIDNVLRPDTNVKLGAFYLGKMLKSFGGNVTLAAAAYNAGPNAVASWLGAGNREADLWVARIPYVETRRYVERVITNLGRYQWLQGGNEAVSRFELALPDKIAVADDAY